MDVVCCLDVDVDIAELEIAGNEVAEIVEIAELESTTRSSVLGTDPARNMTLFTAGSTVGANCRGFVTSDVMDDFVGVRLRISIVRAKDRRNKYRHRFTQVRPLNVR